MKLRRRLLQLVGILTVGAAINVGVAWWLALGLSHPRYVGSGAIAEEQYLALMSSLGWNEKDQGYTRWSSFGARQTDLTSTITIRSRERRVMNVARLTEAGWPLRSLGGARLWSSDAAHAWLADGADRGDLWPTMRFRFSFHVERWVPILQGPQQGGSQLDQVLIPLRPLVIGFAVNTLFYGLFVWLVIVTPFALRRRRRICRGCCPACGYPVGSADVCTECGEPVCARHTTPTTPSEAGPRG